MIGKWVLCNFTVPWRKACGVKKCVGWFYNHSRWGSFNIPFLLPSWDHKRKGLAFLSPPPFCLSATAPWTLLITHSSDPSSLLRKTPKGCVANSNMHKFVPTQIFRRITPPGSKHKISWVFFFADFYCYYLVTTRLIFELLTLLYAAI